MKKIISGFAVFALCSVPVRAMNEKECPPTDSHKTLAGQMHMHSLTVDASVPGQIIQTWTAMGPDGKPMDSTVITLKKVT